MKKFTSFEFLKPTYATFFFSLELFYHMYRSQHMTWFSLCCHQVWKNYKANKILECVDPSFDGGYSVREASNVLQIGLLCTQTSLTLRPSMSEVVRMLNDEEYIIPSPTQAPFLNASILSSDETNQYSAARTSTSNFQTTTERSYYSSDHSFNEQLRTEVSSFRTAAESTTVDSAESSPSKCEASEIR